MSSKPVARLGKGLSALLGESAAVAAPAAGEAAEGPARMIPIDLLVPGPFQPRGPISQASLDELAASIRHAGVLQPMLARPHPTEEGRFQIIAGERRWRASQIAGLHAVPVVVKALADSEAMAAALIENLQREDLNPVEEARGYRRLIDEFGLTHHALAEALGKSRAHLSNTLRLLGLPGAVLDDLAGGRLTSGHARALLAAEKPEALAREVLAKGLSVRQTEARAAARDGLTGKGAGAAGGYADDPDVRALVDDLRGKLGLRIRIDGAGGRGR
ncbi:MAG: ParB/RepB/Spo0J family partition protein, partial [Acetobacteraceae bacterium]|nr:ParB/RepB/Spo0J family partition protein [Acetobacteraceae bacterium]